MFRALHAHPQEAIHKRHLVNCVRVLSVGCTKSPNIPSAVYAALLSLPSAFSLSGSLRPSDCPEIPFTSTSELEMILYL
jgi:hypothetical protein